MRRGNDPVELGQHLVGQIQQTAGHDVHLDAGQEVEAFAEQRLSGFLHHLHVGHGLVGIETNSHPDGLRVIGDRQIRKSPRNRGLGHLSRSGMPVGGVSMRMDVALQLCERDEHRQRASRRNLNFALILAQLGRDPLQTKPSVDLFLGRTRDGVATSDGSKPVLGETQALASCSLAQRHVVRLRTREVLQERTPLRRFDHPQIHLHPVVQDDRGLRIAKRRHVLHARVLGKTLEKRCRVVGGSDEIDVADRLLATTQRAGDLGRHATRLCSQHRDERLGSLECVVEQDHVLTRTAPGLQRLENPQFLLLAKPLQFADVPRLAGRLECLGGIDAELGVEPLGGLWSNARHPHHLDEAVRIDSAQLLQRSHRARRQQLVDLSRDRSTNIRELRQAPFGCHPLDRLGRRPKPFGRLPIRNHLVDDCPIELGQAPKQVEEVRDLRVTHGHQRL